MKNNLHGETRAQLCLRQYQEFMAEFLVQMLKGLPKHFTPVEQSRSLALQHKLSVYNQALTTLLQAFNEWNYRMNPQYDQLHKLLTDEQDSNSEDYLAVKGIQNSEAIHREYMLSALLRPMVILSNEVAELWDIEVAFPDPETELSYFPDMYTN